ncbi:MAG TPA: TonB-dependent receptor [Bacteroidota bacterium]|nr:TonB-dependent receptor [Bacteroidota bacterium]
MKSPVQLNTGRRRLAFPSKPHTAGRFDSPPAFVLFVFLSLVPSGLNAQEPVPEDSIMTVTLDEVVITATRGGGEMLQLPMAVSVVGTRDFFASRRIGLNDALWAMPGVLAQSRTGGQDVRLTVRGFGARGNGDRSNAATVRGIKVLIDGFPETEPDGRTALDLVDLQTTQRIEVVRSNASTLFGNASGGIINIETMPWFTEPFAGTTHLFGSYGFRKHNVNLGTPLGKGRVFLSATNSAMEGYRQHSASQTTNIQTTLTAELDETTRLKLSAIAANHRLDIPGPLTVEQFNADPSRANPVYAARRERRHNRTARFGVQLNKEIAEEHSIEVLGYLTPKILVRSERGTYRDFNRLHVGGGLVYNWHGDGSSLLNHVTAGVDGSSQDGTILFYTLVNGERGDSLRTNKREAATTYGAFIQAEAKLMESLRLVLGGRFNRQVYLSQDFASGARARETRDELVLGHFTPKAALLYRFSPNHSLYVNVSGGVEAPAFNEVDPPPHLTNVSLNPFLKPMASTTTEVGLKGVEPFAPTSFTQMFSYSLAAYSITIRDEIVPFNGGAWFFSAGRSQRYGVEVGGRLDFRGGFTIKSALTLLQAEYKSYSNELGNFAGKSVPGIAPLVFNIRIRYGGGSGFSSELGLEHIGSYYADDANTVMVPSYALLHASLGYALRIGAFHLSTIFGVNNLTNRRYAASAFINPSTVRIDGASPNDGGGRGQPSPAFLEPGLPINPYGGVDIRAEL